MVLYNKINHIQCEAFAAMVTLVEQNPTLVSLQITNFILFRTIETAKNSIDIIIAK